MTTAAPEAEATLSLATQEQQASPLQLSREDGDTEEGKESLAATSDVPGVTQLSRTWEPLATTVSTTAVPLSFEATTTVEGLSGRESDSVLWGWIFFCELISNRASEADGGPVARVDTHTSPGE